MEEKPNNTYHITYSNSFQFEGELLAFRKKQLFKITKKPTLIVFNENCKAWIIKRKQLSILKAKKLVSSKEITVDVSDLQWYDQINLDYGFNLT